MDFDKAIELRRKGWSYKRIAETLGASPGAVRRRFLAQYEQGKLLDISGYSGADPQTRPKSRLCKTRGGVSMLVGEPVHRKLTHDQLCRLAARVEKLGHRTLNDYLLELLLSDLG